MNEPRKIIQGLWPALVILVAALLVSTFVTEFTFVSGTQAIWKTLVRFLRLSATLVIPLLFLPQVCSLMQALLNRGHMQLIQLQEENERVFQPVLYWLLRPFQGIGLAMLFAAKLLYFLQIYSGSRVGTSTILPPGQFYFLRFLTATAIAVAVSWLLSFLWALDDLGVRCYNRKTKEIRMIGKYLGLFLPIFFGFYGIMNIFEDSPWSLAAQYVAQMVIVLYPPFVAFIVFHAWYVKRFKSVLLKKLHVTDEPFMT
ncbi:MAG: hypothetical protein ACE14T_06510 [Syntrophales bacterium]